MRGIVKTEQQVLNCVWSRPELIYKFDREYFLSPTAKTIFSAIKLLYENNVMLSLGNVLTEAVKKNENITKDLLENLRKEDFSIENFEFYFKNLKKIYAKDHIESKLLKEILTEVSSKNELNTEKLENFALDIMEHLEIIEGKESLLMNLYQMMLTYEKTLDDRARNKLTYSTGDSRLDKLITMGFAPGNMTLLFASTGLGKSAYGLSLVNKQINKQIPSMYVSPEMDIIATMDRLCAMRLDIPYSLLYPDENGEVSEQVIDMVRGEAERLKNVRSFYFVEEPNLSITDIGVLAKEAKKKMRTDYLVCTIDLVTMLKEFSGKDPKEMEDGMNRLNELAKTLRIHFFNIAQANRSAENHRVISVEDIQRLRPTISNVKNSGALGERSRVVLSVFREKYYAERFFPESPILDTMEDIMEIAILKQNQGKVGKVLKYLYDGERFKILPFLEGIENNDESI